MYIRGKYISVSEISFNMNLRLEKSLYVNEVQVLFSYRIRSMRCLFFPLMTINGS